MDKRLYKVVLNRISEQKQGGFVYRYLHLGDVELNIAYFLLLLQ